MNFNIFKRNTQDNNQILPPNPIEQPNYTHVGLLFGGKKCVGDSNISAVFAAVELISNTIAQTPIHIVDTETGEINKNHNLNTVFKSGLLTQYTLLKQMVSDVLLHGNGFCFIERADDGTVTNLIYLTPQQVSIQYNQKKHKVYYLCHEISSKAIDAIDMIHLVKNSKDGVNGIGIIAYAQQTLNLAQSANKAAEDFFDSGCNVSGILKSNRQLSDQQRVDVRESWNKVHGSNKAGGGVVVLGNDLDFQSIGATAQASQLLETRAFNILEICRFFNISPVLLGDLSHSAYGSLEQAQLDFLLHCIQPFISLIEAEFNRKLILPKEEYKIDLDENHLMIADKSAMSSYLATLVSNGIMTINEARHILNLAPMEGGDDLIIPYTDINQNTIGNKNVEDKNTETQE